MGATHPQRIVCLSAEAVDILFRLGCGDQVVGVTGFAVEPRLAREKPRVSGFSSVNYDRIESLHPDLVITFSDIQAEASRELIRRGHTVLATNQRTLAEIYTTILLIGRTVGREAEAQHLAAEMHDEIRRTHTINQQYSHKPRIYFEEWDEPLISGICWVSELIEAAGGVDVFTELRDRRRATDRVVTAQDVLRRQPDLIVASWCGRKANLAAICSRPGWDELPAVRFQCVCEIKSAYILQPGPILLKGLRQLCTHIERRFRSRR